ncbi:MAG: site-specific DNA-methyltransferase [Clostridiales bacterium]|jgi:adenine-specific DNA-methyltransferase|nr:site-specific DNA-methyltransferase [Clostridiales bacterium]
MDKLKMQTPNKVNENVERIAALFPNCVTEAIGKDGKPTRVVDFDLLRQELSDFAIEGGEERYQFTWADKKKSILLANSPISKTLRPCREESVNFDTTKNLYIEGDNLDVLKLLQETYMGEVKMIYIDPPYNTGNDFVYGDDFAINAEEYLERSGAEDEDGNRLFQNNDGNGRFHTDWLNMIYPRLKLARDLLTDDGVIFISIDDNEVHNLRKICDEVFGVQNFINTFSVKRGTKSLNSQFEKIKTLNVGFEYVLIYQKTNDFYFKNPFKPATEKQQCGSWAGLYNSPDRPTMRYQIGKKIITQGQWKWSKEKGLRAYENYLEFLRKGGTEATLKDYWERNKDAYFSKTGFDLEFIKETETSASYWVSPKSEVIMDTDLEYSSSGDVSARGLVGNVFSAPKPTDLIQKLVSMVTDEDSLILDFFSGSATTAHAVMQLNAEDGGNRKFILVQLPEQTPENSEAHKAGYDNICEIGKERIRRAGQKVLNDLRYTRREKTVKTAFQTERQKQIGSPNFLTEDNASFGEYTRGQTTLRPQEEYERRAKDLDTGFRVLKLDTSNMKPVYYNPDAAEFTQSFLSTLESNIKEDRTPEDLLFQVMLDMGVDLSNPITAETIGGKKIFTVGNPDSDGLNANLICCFDENITKETVTAIAKRKPLYAVFRDASFNDDATMVSFDQIFVTYSPTTERRVI